MREVFLLLEENGEPYWNMPYASEDIIVLIGWIEFTALRWETALCRKASEIGHGQSNRLQELGAGVWLLWLNTLSDNGSPSAMKGFIGEESALWRHYKATGKPDVRWLIEGIEIYSGHWSDFNMAKATFERKKMGRNWIRDLEYLERINQSRSSTSSQPPCLSG